MKHPAPLQILQQLLHQLLLRPRRQLQQRLLQQQLQLHHCQLAGTRPSIPPTITHTGTTWQQESAPGCGRRQGLLPLPAPQALQLLLHSLTQQWHLLQPQLMHLLLRQVLLHQLLLHLQLHLGPCHLAGSKPVTQTLANRKCPSAATLLEHRCPCGNTVVLPS